jgi:hypothetical protein
MRWKSYSLGVLLFAALLTAGGFVDIRVIPGAFDVIVATRV